MEENKKETAIVRHISFSPEEDKLIRELAEQAGMNVTAFIREMALKGTVKVFDLDALKQHTEAINYIANKINIYTSSQRPNMWLFETDLSLIHEELAFIRESNSILVEIIRNSV